jgi:hypothetical protein
LDAACSRRNGAYPPRQHTHTHTHAKAHTTPPPWEGMLHRILQGKVSYVPPPYRRGRARAGSCSRSPLATCVFFFKYFTWHSLTLTSTFRSSLAMCVFFFTLLLVYIYKYTYIHTYIYVCIYVCMYVCMYVCTYIYIYIYIPCSSSSLATCLTCICAP